MLLADTLIHDSNQFEWPPPQVKAVFKSQRSSRGPVAFLYSADQVFAGVGPHSIFFRVRTDNLYRSLTIGIKPFLSSCGNTHLPEQMVRGRLISVRTRIPPFLNGLERIAVRAAVDKLPASFYPRRQLVVRYRIKRLHIRISHQQDLRIRQGPRIT